ncbi:MAG: complex I NDUFA9 subunit family protein [SAR202 cluster bacterium]|nr:complex I NDUFA9 subunit family protein [SAR202 cluster bacterium]
MFVLVTGATGFVGRHVVKELLARGHAVRALVHRKPANGVLPAPVEAAQGSVSNKKSLQPAAQGCDAVIHLVAVIRKRGPNPFDRINVEGTRNVVQAAKSAGAKRFIHVSALGAQNNERYPYLLSKWRSEEAVKSAGLPYVIYRFSIMFGEGDEFTNSLAGLVKAFPIVPVVGSGKNKFQPIHVEDVARCIVLSLERPELNGDTLELGGPQYLTYDDIIDVIARTLGKRPPKLHIPVAVMKPMAALMDIATPRSPVTTDQLDLLAVPNYAEIGSVEKASGFSPRPMEGNLDYVKKIKASDGLRIALGFMPKHIRDH